jgi:hypothetical protein
LEDFVKKLHHCEWALCVVVVGEEVDSARLHPRHKFGLCLAPVGGFKEVAHRPVQRLVNPLAGERQYLLQDLSDMAALFLGEI